MFVGIAVSFIAGPQKVKLILFHVSAERMCAERVEQVRAEYDQILQQKLSEQVCVLGTAVLSDFLVSEMKVTNLSPSTMPL